MEVTDRRIYTAPWAEQLPDGDLLEHGPSQSTHARRAAAHKLWSWKPGKTAQREARDSVAVRKHMRPDGTHLRSDVPKRELEIFILIFESNLSTRSVARSLGISRSSVKVYVRRLRGRAGL